MIFLNLNPLSASDVNSHHDDMSLLAAVALVQGKSSKIASMFMKEEKICCKKSQQISYIYLLLNQQRQKNCIYSPHNDEKDSCCVEFTPINLSWINL